MARKIKTKTFSLKFQGPIVLASYEWIGDLCDACWVQVQDIMAHAEKLNCNSWYLSVSQIDKNKFATREIFHTANIGGTFSTGELARTIGNRIIQLELLMRKNKVVQSLLDLI